MDNYPTYIGQQPRAQMNERRLEAARQRYGTSGHGVQPDNGFWAGQSAFGMAHTPPGYMPQELIGDMPSAELAPMREALMEKVMMQDFEAFELALYLDTHPGDTAALNMYKHSAARARELTEEYERKFGALTARGVASDTRWTWADGPWPWESR